MYALKFEQVFMTDMEEWRYIKMRSDILRHKMQILYERSVLFLCMVKTMQQKCFPPKMQETVTIQREQHRIIFLSMIFNRLNVNCVSQKCAIMSCLFSVKLRENFEFILCSVLM